MTNEPAPWIQTYTGQAFDLLDPRQWQVSARDIAHALSMLCRYTGHVDRFYSVAEHSIAMATQVPLDLVVHALLHDAAEAYVGDVSSPLKSQLPKFAAIEDNILRVIYKHFGVSPPDAVQTAAIKVADLRMLRTERDQLMTVAPRPWIVADDVEPYPIDVQCWSPEIAKQEWLRVIHVAADDGILFPADVAGGN